MTVTIRRIIVVWVSLVISTAFLNAGSQECVNCQTGQSVWCHQGIFGTRCKMFDQYGREIKNLGMRGDITCEMWGNVEDWSDCRY